MMTESPSATSQGLRRLDPRVVRLWRAGGFLNTIFASLAIGVVCLAGMEFKHALLVTGAVFVIGSTLALTIPRVRYRYWGYQVREGDLFVRKGALWRSTSIIPHARIQHVDTRTGPLERWIGLARVVVYTAGTAGAQTTLPGLAAEDAEALRDRLAALGGAEDAV